MARLADLALNPHPDVMANPRAITQDELEDILSGSREFANLRLPPNLVLDALDFTECSFVQCQFEPAVTRDGDFSGARFKDCTFLPARFASCKFSDVRMENCTLYSVDRKEGCTFAFCEMQTAELLRCNFGSAVFERSDLYNVNAKDCNFRSSKFHGTSFQRSISRKVVVTAAKFDSCNLSFSDMSGLSLRGCTLSGSKFSEALFFNTDFTEADLTNTTIDRAEWDRATLTDADLRGAAITGLNLAVLTAYTGLTISQSQQDALLVELGIKVWPG